MLERVAELIWMVVKIIFMLACFIAAWIADNMGDRVVSAVFCTGVALGFGIEECRKTLSKLVERT